MDVTAKGPLRQVQCRCEYEGEKVLGSRFIATLLPCADADAVVAEQERLRTAHPHSCHVCFAHVGKSELQTRFSDDGEPSKTAGFPMLRVLLGASLRNTGALVVRYFGGTKLGTGGLVRAYTDAVRQAIEQAPLTALAETEQRLLQVSYADEPRVRHWCERHAVEFAVVEYGARDVAVRLTGEVVNLEAVLARLRG
jgi:uncharacterized YigZ family protein